MNKSQFVTSRRLSFPKAAWGKCALTGLCVIIAGCTHNNETITMTPADYFRSDVAEFFESSSRSTTANELVSFEKSIGRTLPADYRRFLLAKNGGSFSTENVHCIPIEPLEWVSNCAPHTLFGMEPTIEHADLATVRSWLADDISDDFVAIGQCGSDFVCIGLSNSSRGRIYYWDSAERMRLPKGQNLYLIANDFHEFLSRITVDGG